MQTSVLRPGLLVSLKTSVVGNVSYKTRDLEPEHMAEDGTRRALWETEKRVEDPAEHEEALKVRSKARSLISAVCSASSFGLLCPEADRDLLSEAVAEAHAIANEFNRNATLTRVQVLVIAGRIAPDDVEAVKAINSEVRDLLTAMEGGLQRLDVKVIREAADKAKQIGTMLSPDAAARIQVAIDTARSAARKIVKAGEEGAAEIDRRALRAITEARTAFLDLDEAAEINTPSAVGRGVDLEVLDQDERPGLDDRQAQPVASYLRSTIPTGIALDLD